jgi:hypothetical protein
MTENIYILQNLEAARLENKIARLHNVYKGIPISHEAQILEVTTQGARFQVKKYSAVCLELQRRTFIECEKLSSIVRCSVVSVDILDETAVMAAFVSLPMHIGKRTAVRVQPKDPIEVEVAYKGHSLKGRLADISTTGIGIYTWAMIYGAGFFTNNTPIAILVTLPGSNTSIKLPGEVQNIQYDGDRYRLGIITNPDATARARVTSYVSFRQAEIQRELHMMYEMFYQVAQRKDK